MWSELRQKVKRIVKKGHRVLHSTAADIKKFEAKYNFTLPKSYVSFLSTFGPGTLNHYFNLYSPLSKYRGRELTSEVREIRASKTLAAIYQDASLLQRSIPFADTIAGDIFAWDPTACTHRTKFEYQIVVMPRYGRKILPIAKEFRAFVQRVCFGHDFEDIVMGQRDPEWQIDYIFEPTSKRAPS
jgi:hypothetical protein